ncbi:Type I phosphodiesterase / nucleotide pyrophosphatase [Botrimarina colliarenosi]|uniref:Type I phosphodiesterase / nucleotide pyrophosphatase n=1 Tax=Botrimarina colliarenosi TaxID=2528001 RepID=A0A5C5ZZJ4_9BACT|nr:alkaline phosphatase family protein [Botrimarina colliarenosi]TWT92451.1 Type I phosphodiesterase / nucleotide pyrophosphatase [Botrimarina colliarenosi]
MTTCVSEDYCRILLIGWDSVDWPAVDSLVAEGSMPAVGRFSSEGTLGKLSPVRPLVSPMLWTSLATGVRADKHGVLGHYDQPLSEGRLRRVSSDSRLCTAIWNWTSEAGLSTHVIGWPATGSTESLLGAMVSGDCFDRGPVDEWLGSCFPNHDPSPAERDRLEHALGIASEGVPSEAYNRGRARLLSVAVASGLPIASLEPLLGRLDALHAVACAMVGHLAGALTAVCYPSVASWFPGAAEKELRDAAWRLQDTMLDDLSRLVDSNTTIALVSPQSAPQVAEAKGRDAGSNPSNSGLGLIGLLGPAVKSGAPLVGATVLDVAPTIAQLLGVPTSGNLDGRALSGVTVEPFKGHSHQPSPAAQPPQTARCDTPADRPEAPTVAADDATCDLVSRNRRVNLALALSDSIRLDQASKVWNSLQSDYPDEPIYAIKLVDCLLRDEQYDVCHDVIQRLAHPLNEHESIRLAIARIAHARDDRDGAASIARELSSRAQITPKVLLNAANLLLACDAEADAVTAFTRCHELGGANPIVLCGLASALWSTERYDASLRAAQAAVAIAPAYTEARFALALALRGCGRDDDAIEQFEQCLREGWLPDDTHTQLASLYWGKDPGRASHHRAMAGVN